MKTTHVLAVVEKARTACRNAGYDPKDHSVDVNKMIDVGKLEQRNAAG